MHPTNIVRLTSAWPRTLLTVCFLFSSVTKNVANGCPMRYTGRLRHVDYTRRGTLNIGIIVSLHKYQPEVLCSDEVRALSLFQQVESMVFAIGEINAKKLIHPNATLGFTIVDDCSNDITAVARALHFYINSGSCYNSYHSDGVEILAIIQASSSGRTIKMADVFSLSDIPQLSFRATSQSLDDKQRYSNFFRIVPSDVWQVRAIVDILQRFQWRYVSMVYFDSVYGAFLSTEIEKEINNIGYCLATVRKINREYTRLDYLNVAIELSEKPNAHVVILVLMVQEVKQLFSVIASDWNSNFTWITVENIGENVEELIEVKDVASGMLSIKLASAPVDRFNDYFQYLTLKNGSKNPWFKEFFGKAFKCNPDEEGSCNWDTPIKNAALYAPDDTVSLSMDAVYAVAFAMKAVFDNCSDTKSSRHCMYASTLKDALKRLKFKGEYKQISFENMESIYDIVNVYFDNGKFVHKKVGEWNSTLQDFTFFQTKNLTWNWDLFRSTSNMYLDHRSPVSMCYKPCSIGEEEVPTTLCCWKCKPCKVNERTVIVNNMPMCDKCPKLRNFTWPDNSTRRECLPIPVVFFGFKQATDVLLFAGTLIVLLNALTIATLYVVHRNQRLIKACCKEISLMMLGGQVIVCLLAMTYFLKPVYATCVLARICFSTSLTVVYGPLLVKTNRTYRMVIARKLSAQRPRCTDCIGNVVLIFIIIGVEMSLIAVELIIHPPVVSHVMPLEFDPYVEQACDTDMRGFYFSLFFNFILMVGCAVHAYNVRHVPTDFKDARFIIISMYCIVLLWISMIPGYLTASTLISKTRWLFTFLLLNMLVSQTFLLSPRLYAVLITIRYNRKKSRLHSQFSLN